MKNFLYGMMICVILVLAGCGSGFDETGDAQPQAVDLNTWAGTRFLGTTAGEEGKGIVVDDSGNVYIAGWTGGDLGGNGNAGGSDVFLVKYNTKGEIVWLNQLGSSASETVEGIALDRDGNIIIAGYTSGDLDGNGNRGEADAFLAKFNASGEQLWLRQLGSDKSDSVIDLAVDVHKDRNNDIYITGSTYGNLSGSAAGTSRDFYAARYTSSGNLEWIKQLGTNDISGDPTDDMERSVAVDSTGNVVVAGISYNTSSDTNRGANDNSQAIALDAVGNIYLTGAVEGRLEGNVSAGSVDVFFTKIIASGD